MPRIALLSTSYLRHPKDLSGIFIHNIIEKICDKNNDFEFEIIMPAEAGYPKKEKWGKIHINRFQYFLPFDKQRLATDSGIPTDLSQSWLAKIQLPFFLIAFFYTAFKVSRKCDLIHAHFFPCGLIALGVGFILRKKVILTLHGTDYRILKPFTNYKILKYIMSKFKEIIVLGQDANNLMNNIGVPASKIKKSRIAIDENLFYELPPFEKEHVNLLWVGRAVPVKNIDLLLECLNEINDQRLRLTLIGSGSEKERLQAHIQKTPNLKNIKWLGQMPNHQLIPFYQKADFFILTSNNEGLPATILEAMACGTPVITTKVGSIPEIIKQDQNGFLFDAGNKSQLILILRKIISNQFNFHELRSNARKTILEEFSLDKISEQTENLYRSL